MRSVESLLGELFCIVSPRRLALAAGFGLAFCAPELCAQADFQVDSDLVVLHVTVTDHQGRVVRDLPRSAFHIYEDGAPQGMKLFRYEDRPVAVGLVVDSSGSMRRKLPEVVAAATEFARSSNPEDRMFVVNFNEHVWLGLPPGEAFVSDPDELKAALSQIRANGKTALYDAVASALGHVRQSPLPRKVLIVLSDGGDNASTRRFPQILSLIQQSDVVVYTVGLFDEYSGSGNEGAAGKTDLLKG